jgi:8-oxo-dGTP pyrophosphatase MutT (NUDIX family)
MGGCRDSSTSAKTSVSPPDHSPELRHQPPTVSDSGAGFRHLGDEVQVRGWRISLVRAAYSSPDGERFTRDVVRHPGAVAVVPATTRDTVLLVRQYRGPVDRVLFEIPAGTRDVHGEDPAHTARRELQEEVGMRAGSVEKLTSILNSPGFCDEETLVYLARDLEPVPTDREGPEERFIEVVERSWEEIDAMLAAGDIVDAQTVIGLLLARPLVQGTS